MTERPHGSVAEEIAALAEALRSRVPRGDSAAADSTGERGAADAGAHGAGAKSSAGTSRSAEGACDCSCHHPHARVDACEICPVCRVIGALHTVSPSAVDALADLAKQAEVALRALAVDLQSRDEAPSTTAREDIVVDDLDDD